MTDTNPTFDALILREVSVNENDKIITVLCAERGKMSVLAKGVKSIKSKNAPSLQPFSYSTLELSEKNGRYTLKTATLKENFHGVTEDITRLCLASYFSEIITAVCTENSDETEMLRLTLNCLYALSYIRDIPIPIIKAAFELKALSVAGFMPDLYYCSCCGRDKSENEDDKDFCPKRGKVSFFMLEGTLLCNDCLGDEEIAESRDLVFELSYPTLYAMRYVTEAEQKKILSFKLPPEYIAEFSEVCERFLSIQTDRSYYTLVHYKNALQNTEK